MKNLIQDLFIQIINRLLSKTKKRDELKEAVQSPKIQVQAVNVADQAAFRSRFAKLVGKQAAGRFDLQFSANADLNSSSLVVDDSLFKNTNKAHIAFIKVLRDLDERQFAAMVPFINALNPGIAQRMNKEELRAALQVISSSDQATVPLGIQDGELLPQYIEDASTIEENARQLDTALAKAVLGDNVPLIAALDQTMAYMRTATVESFEELVSAVGNTFKTRLVNSDPSFWDVDVTAVQPLEGAVKDMVIRADAFILEGNGLPMALRIERLRELSKGGLRFSLAIENPMAFDIAPSDNETMTAQFLEIYPEAAIFQNILIGKSAVQGYIQKAEDIAVVELERTEYITLPSKVLHVRITAPTEGELTTTGAIEAAANNLYKGVKGLRPFTPKPLTAELATLLREIEKAKRSFAASA